jgi:hypothetical protein
MKGWGQVCSNEEQFAFPLLICNQILYHVFSVNRNPNLMIFVSEFFKNQHLFIYDNFSYVIPFLGCCLYTLYCSL